MIAAGRLRKDADAKGLSLAVFATLQGGLMLTATDKSIQPLEAALDLALTALHAQASHEECGAAANGISRDAAPRYAPLMDP